MAKLQLLKQLVSLRYCTMHLVFKAIQVPEYVINEMNKRLSKFLWGPGKENVRRRTTVKICVRVVYK